MLGWLQLVGAAPTNTEPMAWMYSSTDSPAAHGPTSTVGDG